MSIHADQTDFHLSNPFMSLVLSLHSMVDGSVTPLMRYMGARLPTGDFHTQPLDDHEQQGSFDLPDTLLPFACPTGGHGDNRPTQLTLLGGDGNSCTRLSYRSHAVYAGRKSLAGLPATYVEAPEEAETLEFLLVDELRNAEVRLRYTLFAHRAALAVSLEIANKGQEPLILTEAASLCLSLPGPYEMIHLYGAWGRERWVERTPPMHGERAIGSKRGASSHEHNPFVCLVRPDTTEFSGEAWGINLVYSGSFTLRVHQDAYDQTRLVGGLACDGFRWTLSPGESFQTPEAVLVYSDRGLNGMSQSFQSLYRERLCRGLWRDRERPVLLNNWEATYFDFNEEKLLGIAKAAKALGVELFVLDDGWFGRRDSDNCSLGDWTPDLRKLPGGLSSLSRKLHELGLMFGLWFEPEMISPDSDLYRLHPDWCLHAPGRHRTTSRNQLILDMSRPQVQDYVTETLSRQLAEGSIDYVKWDMNRNFTEIGSLELEPSRQGELPHRYILGVYRVMEALTARHPQVLFEGCSGGGGRFDPGILYYMPQIWASDNSDAVERLKIQYGTSFPYPPSAISAHVSAIPNHQVRRKTGLDIRGHVAMSGVFGYELDLSAMSLEEQTRVAAQIALYKEIRPIIQHGTFTRLLSPFEGNLCAWQFTGQDHVLVFVFQVLQHAAKLFPSVKLHDLPQGIYQDMDNGLRHDSRFLERVGLTLDFGAAVPAQGDGDFSSRLIRLTRCQE